MAQATTQKSSQPTKGITFAVSDVERAVKPLPELPYSQALAAALRVDDRRMDQAIAALEAYSRNSETLVSLRYPYPQEMIEETYDIGVDLQNQPVYPFMQGLHLAYDRHHPFVMSPDMIWLLIAQGVALHVNANFEALRNRFVQHDGKVEIKVQRNEFIRGFAGNDWEGVFAEFSEQIKPHIPDRAYPLFVRQFSTTGIAEKAAFEITLLNAVQKYFDYRLISACGIPEITLEGTPEDWEAVRSGAEALDEYDLSWWTPHLLPVLDQFVAASKGEINLTFWRSFYNLENWCGGPYINGHVLNLLPYILSAPASNWEWQQQIRKTRQQHEDSFDRAKAHLEQETAFQNRPVRNPYLGWKDIAQDTYRPINPGLTSDMLTASLSTVPFTWEFQESELPMEFTAGFVGLVQDTETLALRPEIGWAVRERHNMILDLE